MTRFEMVAGDPMVPGMKAAAKCSVLVSGGSPSVETWIRNGCPTVTGTCTTLPAAAPHTTSVGSLQPPLKTATAVSKSLPAVATINVPPAGGTNSYQTVREIPLIAQEGTGSSSSHAAAVVSSVSKCGSVSRPLASSQRSFAGGTCGVCSMAA